MYFACGMDMNLWGRLYIGRIIAPKDVHILSPESGSVLRYMAKRNYDCR